MKDEERIDALELRIKELENDMEDIRTVISMQNELISRMTDELESCVKKLSQMYRML